jgi:hypothetical protein
VPVAVNCWVFPTVTEIFAGVIAKDARVRGEVLDVLLPHPAKVKHNVTAMKNAILRPI